MLQSNNRQDTFMWKKGTTVEFKYSLKQENISINSDSNTCRRHGAYNTSESIFVTDKGHLLIQAVKSQNDKASRE